MVLAVFRIMQQSNQLKHSYKTLKLIGPKKVLIYIKM
jgi:hypothetical protein